MQNYFNLIIERLEQGKSLASLTVIEQDGSTPRGSCSKMLVEKGQEGTVGIWGHIGGGLLEEKAMEGAVETIRDGLPRIMDFDLNEEMQARDEMLCRTNKVKVLAELFSPVDLDFFLNYQEEWKLRKQVFVSINLADGTRRLLNEAVAEPDRALIKKVVKKRSSCSVSHKSKEYFIEYKPVVPRLILVGGGYVGLCTAKIMNMTGFELVVIDDHQDYSNQSRFPEAEAVMVKQEYKDCFADVDVDQDSYIVILTYNHQNDCTALAQALRTKAGYIGMIRSRAKRDIIYEALQEQGFSKTELERVHCPIGFPIKAETPQEIAVSIAAELIAVRRGG